MPASDHYDVIVIGTGAGGARSRTPSPQSGKQILLLERGDFLPRETENWDPAPVFVDGRYISPDTWFDADGTPFQPQVHYFVGGATKMYGAALYRLRPQDFGEITHVDGISPAWPLELRRLRTLVHARPSGSTRFTATTARIPPRGTGRKAIPVAGGLARTPDPGARRQPHSRWLSPVPGPVRHPARRSRPGSQRVHPLLVVRWLPLPRAREVRRRDDRGAAPAGRTERDTARRGRGGQARYRPDRPHRQRGRGVPPRRRRTVRRRHRRGRRRRGQQRQAAAAIRRSTTTRTGSPTAPTRSVATTCSTTPRRSWRWPRNPTTPCSRRPSASTTSTSPTASSSSRLGNIQMVGKSNGWAMKGEEPTTDPARPALEPRRGRPPRRRLLAHHRRPPRRRQPRHPRRSGATSTCATPRTTTPKPTASTTS